MCYVESPKTDQIIAHLKQIYHRYIQTKDVDEKSRFFSPACRQVCRPTPSFAAKEKSTIVQYLHNTVGKDTETIQNLMDDPAIPRSEKQCSLSRRPRDQAESTQKKKSFYSIRPLRETELEFGTDLIVRLAGFSSTEDVKRAAREEGWVGMRVDLWDDEGLDEAGKKKGTLVKVQYWWRIEHGEWLQIFHDIIYLGQRDGTEGSEGDAVEQF